MSSCGPMRARPWVVSVCGVLLVGGLASAIDCGGTTASSGGSDAAADATGGPGADGSPFLDAGVDTGVDAPFGCGVLCEAGFDAPPPLPACPAAPPGAGSPCPSQNEVCEYGSSWWLDCNVVVRCETGKWALQHDGGGCDWLDAGSACPATWDEANGVDAALQTCPFTTCVYPEGFCGCGVACGGGGGEVQRPMIDGIFVCIPSTPQCPEPRPLSGAPCDSGAGCDYGFACGCGQVEQCVDGLWQASPAPVCP